MARMPSVFNLRPIRGARLPQVTIEMTKPVLPPVKEPEPEVVVETPPPAAVEPEGYSDGRVLARLLVLDVDDERQRDQAPCFLRVHPPSQRRDARVQ